MPPWVLETPRSLTLFPTRPKRTTQLESGGKWASCLRARIRASFWARAALIIVRMSAMEEHGAIASSTPVRVPCLGALSTTQGHEPCSLLLSSSPQEALSALTFRRYAFKPSLMRSVTSTPLRSTGATPRRKNRQDGVLANSTQSFLARSLSLAAMSLHLRHFRLEVVGTRLRSTRPRVYLRRRDESLQVKPSSVDPMTKVPLAVGRMDAGKGSDMEADNSQCNRLAQIRVSTLPPQT